MSNSSSINTIFDNARHNSSTGMHNSYNPFRKMSHEHLAYALGSSVVTEEFQAFKHNAFKAEDGQVYGVACTINAHKEQMAPSDPLIADNKAGEFTVFTPKNNSDEQRTFELLSDACDYLSDLVLRELYKQWANFGDTPVFPEDTDDTETADGYSADSIEEEFLSFPIGTPREDIWHWFEDQHPEFLVGEVMNGNSKNLDHLSSESLRM